MNLALNKGKFNIKKYERFLPLISFFIFFSFIILAYFVLSPFYKVILRQENEEIPKKSNNIEIRRSNLDQLSKFREDIPDFEDKVEVLDKIASTQNDMGQFLVQFLSIAKNSNLILSSFSPEISKNGSMAAKVELKGNYEYFENFLESLENNLLIIDVESIRISGASGVFNYSLNVVAPSI